jgi:hypothetical protein
MFDPAGSGQPASCIEGSLVGIEFNSCLAIRQQDKSWKNANNLQRLRLPSRCTHIAGKRTEVLVALASLFPTLELNRGRNHSSALCMHTELRLRLTDCPAGGIVWLIERRTDLWVRF